MHRHDTSAAEFMCVCVEEKTIESSLDAKIYEDTIMMVPPESISVPLILHGILEEVELHVSHAHSKVLPPTDHDDDVGRYLRDKLMALSMTKEQEKVTVIGRSRARLLHEFCLRFRRWRISFPSRPSLK